MAIIHAFLRVFGDSQTLREMDGEAMRIQLTDDARPFAVTAAQSIPFNWRDDMKTQLDELLDLDIIDQVNHPTDWCHPIVPVRKKSGGVRLCVDLTRLNKYVRRPAYPLPSPHDVIASMGTGSQ